MLYKNEHSNKNYNNVYHWLIGNWFIYLFHTEFNICAFFWWKLCLANVSKFIWQTDIYTHTQLYKYNIVTFEQM